MEEMGVVLLYGANKNTLKGNYIGLDATGKLPLGNAGAGVMITTASYTTIGGTIPGEGNIISDNEVAGIALHSSSHNAITGNYLGTDYSGTISNGK